MSKSKTATEFVGHLKSQVGDRYVYGAEVDLNDPDPKAHGKPFDCSEITQWSAYQTGLYLPDGAMNQREYCRSHGTLYSAAHGLATFGSLLFHGPSGPHVATSLGNGWCVEAANSSKPVGVYRATGRPWTHAGWCPGMIADTPGAVTVGTPTAPNPLAVARFMINLSKRQVIGSGAGMVDHGDAVEWCQILLNAKLDMKHSPGGVLSGGTYDHRTHQALMWFQAVTINGSRALFGLPKAVCEDGVCDRDTWSWLDRP